MTDKAVTPRARQLRRQQSGVEARLWSHLRGYKLAGLKFRRQHPIGSYVVDFACVSARLVVELDGPSHRDDEQANFDHWRTQDLIAHGWTVIRFSNQDVVGKLPLVLAAIERAAEHPLAA